MALPLFRLLQTEVTIDVPGAIVGERYHEKEANTYEWKIEIPEGYVIPTVWQGKLHEVIYQTPAKDERTAAERNAALRNSRQRIRQNLPPGGPAPIRVVELY